MAAAAAAPAPAPDNIEFKSQVFAVDFHPSAPIVAAGLISGFVKLYRIGSDENALLHQLRAHKSSCRALAFAPDGRILFSAGKDKALKAIDVETGRVVRTVTQAHADPINVLCAAALQPLLFSGDDEGRISVWDTVSGTRVHTFAEHHDFISSLAYVDQRRTLVAGSGDGCVSGWNIKKMDVDGISANLDDEVLSLCVVRGRRQVVCGTQGGIVHAFNFGEWEEPVASYRGHPSSIDAMATVDDDTVLTGSSDGLIRLVQISPHKVLGVLGDHEDFPVERFRLSHDRRVLASTSHDTTLRFWDVSQIFEDVEEAAAASADSAPSAPTAEEAVEDEEMEDAEPSSAASTAPLQRAPAKKKRSKKSFFSGL